MPQLRTRIVVTFRIGSPDTGGNQVAVLEIFQQPGVDSARFFAVSFQSQYEGPDPRSAKRNCGGANKSAGPLPRRNPR
jgi:hypothetical protein